ncbi:MAG: hypothetical protein JNL10_08855 [Verrucomicrobiales bacterium]|nr:hypothetical protein [Verrucomicrobiales bacterium]
MKSTRPRPLGIAGAWVQARSRWICLLSLIAMTASAATNLPALAVLNSPRPLVIAHRGYSSMAPENTLPAFERALAAGADLIELDYHHTRDGQLIVIHDDTLDRTTDAAQRWGGRNLRVSDRTLGELRELKAGAGFEPPHPGTRLPTLAEAMALIQRGSVTLIERKAGDAAACVELLRKQGLVNRVVVQSFDWDYLRDYRRLEPDQVLGALGPPGSHEGRKLSDAEKALSPSWLDEIRELGIQVAVWNRQVDAAAVQAAHARGLKVWVYTIDDPQVADALLAAGVDGIITNNPAIVWKVLATRRAGG